MPSFSMSFQPSRSFFTRPASMMPGAIAFTLILSGRTSTAIERVKAATAPSAGAEQFRLATRSATIDDMLMIEPPPLIMCGMPSLEQGNVPEISSLITRRQPVRRHPLPDRPPAMNRPRCCAEHAGRQSVATVSAKAASTCACSCLAPTSTRTGIATGVLAARPCGVRRRRTTRRINLRKNHLCAFFAKRSAVARPMPPPPPVINATFPATWGDWKSSPQ